MTYTGYEGIEDYKQEDIEITASAGIVLESVKKTNPVCGQNNGAVTVKVAGSGNASDIVYKLFKEDETAVLAEAGQPNVFKNLNKGKYTVSVENRLTGCVYTEEVELEPDPFVITPDSYIIIKHPTEKSKKSGIFYITQDSWGNGEHAYTFDLKFGDEKKVIKENVAFQESFVGMEAGKYQIVVKDETALCQGEPFDFTLDALKEGASIKATPASCALNDGIITLTPNTPNEKVVVKLENAKGELKSKEGKDKLVFESLPPGEYKLTMNYLSYTKISAIEKDKIEITAPEDCPSVGPCIEIGSTGITKAGCISGDDEGGTFAVAGIKNGKGPFRYTLYDSENNKVKSLEAEETSASFTGLEAGSYFVKVEDLGRSSDCEASTEIQKIETSRLVKVVKLSKQIQTCYNNVSASFEIDGPGNYQYYVDKEGHQEWKNFDTYPTIFKLPKGEYDIRFRSGEKDDCPYILAMNVKPDISNPIVIVPEIVNPASCDSNDGSFRFKTPTGGAGGPYTYEFRGSAYTLPKDGIVTGLTRVPQEFTVVDSRGCKEVFMVGAGGPDLVYFDLETTEPTCDGNGLDGSIVVKVDATRTKVNPPFLVTIAQGKKVLAAQKTMTSLVHGFKGFAQGSYEVLVSKENSSEACPNQQVAEVTGGKTNVAFKVEVNSPTCKSAEAVIKVYDVKGQQGQPYQFELTNNNDRAAVHTHSFDAGKYEYKSKELPTGQYRVKVSQSQASCTIFDTVSIKLKRPLRKLEIVKASADTLNKPYNDATGNLGRIFLNNIVRSGEPAYTASIEAVESDWYSAGEMIQEQELRPDRDSSNPHEHTFTDLYPGLFDVIVKDKAGCSDTVKVTLDENLSIWAPNLFTPNGDGFNETFYIRNMPEEPGKGWKMKIMDRFGKVVYESADYWKENAWDADGEQDGVYFFSLDTGKQKLNGWIEIRRGKPRIAE